MGRLCLDRGFRLGLGLPDRRAVLSSFAGNVGLFEAQIARNNRYPSDSEGMYTIEFIEVSD